MSSQNKRAIAALIIVVALSALAALIGGCSAGNPAVDQSRPALTWSF